MPILKGSVFVLQFPPAIARPLATLRPFARDRRGVAVMEFALVAPLLALIAMGILNYGQYFLLAHSTQQIANDAARATIAGLSAAERVTLAEAMVTKEMTQLPVGAGQVAVAVTENGTDKLVTVKVRVDASSNAMFKLKIVPMPEAIIERSGTVRQGGLE